MKFTDVCIMTNRVKDLLVFYEKIFQVEGQGNNLHASLDLEDLKIVFYDRDQAQDLIGFDLSTSSTGMSYLGFDVADIEATYRRLEGLGLPYMSDLKTWPWGARSFNVKDLDGNRIMFRTWTSKEGTRT